MPLTNEERLERLNDAIVECRRACTPDGWDALPPESQFMLMVLHAVIHDERLGLSDAEQFRCGQIAAEYMTTTPASHR